MAGHRQEVSQAQSSSSPENSAESGPARYTPGRLSPFKTPPDPRRAGEGITEEEVLLFDHLTSITLTPEEEELAARPDRVAPEAEQFLAVHWHPEWAPLDLIDRRLKTAFPRADHNLVIPTQHNKIMSFGPWAGVEADVYDRRYGLKVQLLIHFRADKLGRAGVLASMMDHTYNNRAHQLLDILDRLINPEVLPDQVKKSLKCSVDEESITMARFYAARLKALIERSGIIGSARDEMLKNRLLPDFLLACAGPQQRFQAEQALMFISVVKKSVKAALRPEAFHSPQEVIEEARSLGGGIVIPHPPAFWPILLSNLDVDGWEIWNPSTPRHTLFLLEALNSINEHRVAKRRLLAFMGDDTHMSAKFRRNLSDEKDSVGREIGFQDTWNQPEVSAALGRAGQGLRRTLDEYRSRLS